MGAGGEHPGHVDRGLESEGFVDEGDVVVDRLGDGDDADGETAPRRFLCDIVGAARRAVSADAEENVDVHSGECIDHHDGIFRAAGAAEDGSAGFMNVIGIGVVEQNRLKFVIGVEAAIAVADAIDQRHAVLNAQRAGEKFDDVVEAGAEAAGGEDGRFGPCRVVIDFRPGPRLFECRNLHSAPEVLGEKVRIRIVGHRSFIGNKFNLTDRRGDCRFAEF